MSSATMRMKGSHAICTRGWAMWSASRSGSHATHRSWAGGWGGGVEDGVFTEQCPIGASGARTPTVIMIGECTQWQSAIGGCHCSQMPLTQRSDAVSLENLRVMPQKPF